MPNKLTPLTPVNKNKEDIPFYSILAVEQWTWAATSLDANV